MSSRLSLAALAVSCLALSLGAPVAAMAANPPASDNRLQTLQVLSITDFHGALDTGGTVTVEGKRVPAGGAAYLSTHLNEARQGQQRSITLANGDNVGASPLISAAFHDEPTIEAFNLLGVDASTIGNHEFDEGYREMLRLIKGGSYTIINEKGIKVGVIGAVLEQTPEIVTASGVAGLEFRDETAAINRASAELTARGIHTQIVLVHQGANASRSAYTANCADGATVEGPVVEIAERSAPAVDMVITGHSHQSWICQINDPAGQPRLVTQAMSAGRILTEATLQYDPKTKDIVRRTATAANHLVTRDVAPDPKVQALVDRYAAHVAPIANRVIGSLTTEATRDAAPGFGDSPLGNLIADAQLADDTIVGAYAEPQIAFINPGGIRADLDAGDVTYGEAFTVQPFNNYLVSMTLTGDQIYQLLTEQVTGNNSPANGGFNKILQVSEGFTYTLGAAGPVDGSVMLNGTPIDRNASYRVVANAFVADGGDNFPTFVQGTDRLIGGLDIDAFADYLEANAPVTPPASSRIVRG